MIRQMKLHPVHSGDRRNDHSVPSHYSFLIREDGRVKKIKNKNKKRMNSWVLLWHKMISTKCLKRMSLRRGSAAVLPAVQADIPSLVVLSEIRSQQRHVLFLEMLFTGERRRSLNKNRSNPHLEGEQTVSDSQRPLLGNKYAPTDVYFTDTPI